MEMIKRIFAPAFALKGNARYAVLTEPLWGVPHTLYAPFFALYMFHLGVHDANIGIIITVGLIVQMVSSVFGGVLTDKYGRRLTNVLWDHLSWTVACLLWAFAQDFRWFLIAAVLNSTWPIGANAWECLLVEDEEPSKIGQLFNWIYIAGLLAVFFAPISFLLMRMFNLVPVMRGLLIFAATAMSAKFIIHYIYATETKQGVIRLKETAGVPIGRLLLQNIDVLKKIFTTPATWRILILITVLHIKMTIAGTFFSLYITLDLGFPEQYLPLLTVILRSAIMLAFFLVFQRILDRYSMYLIMICGLVLYIGAYVLLLLTPAGVVFPLVIFVAADACAWALFMPRRDAMVVNNIDPAERARIRALLMALMVGFASPFGFIAGRLAEVDRRIPFAACLGLFVIMGIIVWIERSKKNAELRIAETN